jgi:hypothetical protein
MSPGNGSFCCILQRLLTMSVLITYILLLFSGFCIGHSLQGISPFYSVFLIFAVWCDMSLLKQSCSVKLVLFRVRSIRCLA